MSRSENSVVIAAGQHGDLAGGTGLTIAELAGACREAAQKRPADY